MKLYLNTVSDVLWQTLKQLMLIEELHSFRIVGGTSLSLQLGHRASIDIDLFTDADYGSIDFAKLEDILIQTFPYVEKSSVDLVGLGKSYFIGTTESDVVKLDLFYTDPFVFPCSTEQGVRFSSIEEVAAMKFEIIAQGGRKKDFWDIHELLETYSLNDMIDFYLKRNPYGYSKDELLTKVVDFSVAEKDFTPKCLKGKVWELIKIDIENSLK
ncbi:nucleotidyl transferase AbiEii/AbiGii toxin family protein [Algibacter sp. 2305UL17-15]|uniref:nucleotidyl transferase AbiEii/AbiGii toxin family protein n=1 Tax=Algibacter sp. 2305UL17-15 TaxID=3231268 RepID=UPI00345A573F